MRYLVSFILCTVLCICWLIQLFSGPGWRFMHLVMFVLSALIAAGSFVQIRRDRKNQQSSPGFKVALNTLITIFCLLFVLFFVVLLLKKLTH
jgi:succinate dehydrogenase hydrophobic anchor subunit